MSPSSSRCPACGKAASGRFCGACGAALAGRACGSCGAALGPGARFCGACGAAAGAGAARGAAGSPAPSDPVRLIWPFAVAAVAVVAALLVFLIPREPAVAPAAAPFAAGAPAPLPDLATLPARARFDTLYNRVMRASEQGDQVSVSRFAPMALQAYTQLDAVDADARYHAAMIRLHTSDPAGAAAVADTITQLQATHLFGYVIRGTVARLQQDDARLGREQAEFLRHYDAEIAAGRPEYTDHKFILDQFVSEARARAGRQ